MTSNAGDRDHFPLLVHEERDVLDMVILVACDDVEHHPPELLFGILHRQTQAADDHQRLLVRVSQGVVEVEVRQSGQRLHVQFLAVVEPVEPARHEVPSPVLLEKPAFGHSDSRGPGHERIGVLNRAEPLWVRQIAVFVVEDAVKLQQPVFKPRRRLDLSRAHLMRFRVPGNDRLGAGAARRRADAEDFTQCVFPVGVSKRRLKVLAVVQHLGRQFDQGRRFLRASTFGFGGLARA